MIGEWKYEFYQDSILIGTAVVTIGSEPVKIEGKGFRWFSSFDMDETPDIVRSITDEQGNEVYRLVYRQQGFYQAKSRNNTVDIEIKNRRYLFGAAGMPVTAMMEKTNIGFRTTFFEDVSDGYMMMALSFPALRIY